MTNTQAFIIAAGIAIGGIGFAWAQGSSFVSPASVNGCVVYASPVTLSDGYRTAFTCDLTGKLRVTTTF